MKKLIILFCLILIFAGSAYAEDINIDSNNYDTYFTNTGTQNINDGDTITFSESMGYRFTNIDKNITVTSRENVVLTDVCISLNEGSSGTTIKNLNMENSIYTFRINADNILLTNNNIKLTNTQSIPIVSMQISDTDNVRLENNNIEAYATSSTYNILILNNNNLQLTNNTITLKTRETTVFWNDQMVGLYDGSNIEIRESQNIKLEGNTIKTESLGYNTPYGTIVNIHSLKTNSLQLTNNQITTTAYQYAYGIVLDNTNATLTKNNINSNAVNYANALTIQNSTTQTKENTLNTTANLSYPLYIVNTDNNLIENNNIYGDGNYNYAIEIYNSKDNTITKNNINLNGEYTLGIGIAQSSTGTQITQNTITTQGSKDGEIKCGDYIPCENVGIKLIENSQNTNINSNTITSKGKYTINRGENTPTITNNNLQSKDNTGIITVYPPEENIIITTITIENYTGYYGENKNLKGKLTDQNGNPIIGHHLNLNLTRTTSGANKVYQVTTDINGEFNFQINLAPGQYTAKAQYQETIVGDKTYTNSTSNTASLIITTSPNSTIIQMENYNQPYQGDNWNKDLTGTLTYTNQTSIIGRHVNLKLTRLSSGASKTYDTTTDYNGIFTLKIRLAPGQYQVEASFNDEDFTPAYKTISMTITST